MRPDPLFEKEVRDGVATFGPMVSRDPGLALRLAYGFAVRGGRGCSDQALVTAFQGLADACMEAMGGEEVLVPPDDTPAYRLYWPWDPWVWEACLETTRRLALRHGALDERVKAWMEHLLGLLRSRVEREGVA